MLLLEPPVLMRSCIEQWPIMVEEGLPGNVLEECVPVNLALPWLSMVHSRD